MSKDIGNFIWELAKSDRTFEGKNLKDDFLKKINLDKILIREKLRDMVLNHIKTETQPFNTYIILDATNDIFGRTVNFDIHYITDQNRENLDNITKGSHYFRKQMCAGGEAYVEILNSQTKYLIDNAIVPLNLEWSIRFSERQMIISWAHWLD